MDVFGRRHAQIVHLAERQYGHVRRSQLLALGVASRTITAWIARGWLIRVYPGVYAVGHRRMEAVAVAAAARLACGDDAALSHDTAAALWGLHDRWPARPEVSSGPGRRVRISGIRHHRTKTLMRADVRRHRGLRVTSPARTLNDLRPRLSERQYVRLINDARLKGLLNADAAAALHPDARAEQPPSRSVFEDEVASALRHGGFPDFQVNVRLFGREVDLLFEAQKLIVELDGWAYHSDRDAHERDRVKDAQALARGYVTVRITWRRWRSARAEVMAELEAVLRRAA